MDATSSISAQAPRYSLCLCMEPGENIKHQEVECSPSGEPRDPWAGGTIMKDRLGQEHLEATTPRAGAKVDVVERRSAQRQHFVAEAQIIELKTGAKLLARTGDLAVHGCYVDTTNPFQVGTSVRIRLKKENTTVETNGQVVYGIPGVGMGIAFQNLTPANRAALEKWLSSIYLGEDLFEVLTPAIAIGKPAAMQQRPAGQMVDLILLLMKKGILNRAEAAGLLGPSLEE
jgi:PilZ domain